VVAAGFVTQIEISMESRVHSGVFVVAAGFVTQIEISMES
jgi:hypothetical protein